jgi:chloride channel 3/4/5
MIVVGVTKAVGDLFSKGGIADRMIWFNGFPFLDNKEEHTFGVPVSQVTTHDLKTLPASGMLVKAAQKLLEDTPFSGFSVIEDVHSQILVGYIGRTELQFAIDRARKQGMVSSEATCSFVPDPAHEAHTPSTEQTPITFDAMAQQNVDFSAFVDLTPITVHPRLPLETVMELFKKMGPRVILVEHYGRLEGLVTVKDCLKYQFKVEAQEHATGGRDDPSESRQEMFRDLMQRAADWFADRLNHLSNGRLNLNPQLASGGSRWSRLRNADDFVVSPADDYRNEHEILDGTEDIGDHHGVELDDR